MRHVKRGRKLGRTGSHRKATLNNMSTALFEHGAIRTTYAKAKEVRSMAERLITFAKRGDLHARRQVLRRIRNKVVVSKLFNEIAPAFADRNGGYTRVLKLGVRRGDSTEVCLVELVGEEFRADYADRSASRTKAPARSPAVKPEAPAAPAEAQGQAPPEGGEAPGAEEAAGGDRKPDGEAETPGGTEKQAT